jgi:hypothetical protein
MNDAAPGPYASILHNVAVAAVAIPRVVDVVRAVMTSNRERAALISAFDPKGDPLAATEKYFTTVAVDSVRLSIHSVAAWRILEMFDQRCDSMLSNDRRVMNCLADSEHDAMFVIARSPSNIADTVGGTPCMPVPSLVGCISSFSGRTIASSGRFDAELLSIRFGLTGMRMHAKAWQALCRASYSWSLSWVSMLDSRSMTLRRPKLSAKCSELVKGTDLVG